MVTFITENDFAENDNPTYNMFKICDGRKLNFYAGVYKNCH